MKKLFLLTLSALLLLTGCAPEEPVSVELPYEKLADELYVNYDRTKFENTAAVPIYYAEYIKPDDSALIPYFSASPKIYDERNDREFENDSEHGYYNSHGHVFFGSGDWACISVMSEHFFRYSNSSPKDLDFMPMSEVYKKFNDDVHKFIEKYEICEITAISAEEFAEATAAVSAPINHDGERVWCEPRDVYYITARQIVDETPIFTGVSPTSIETAFHDGAEIEACYTKNGLEHLSLTGYKIGEEKDNENDFIDFEKAEQIIREEYVAAYGAENTVLIDAELVYVGVFDGDKTILTPAWEFYFGLDYSPVSPYRKQNQVIIRLNAYTGEFMRWS